MCIVHACGCLELPYLAVWRHCRWSSQEYSEARLAASWPRNFAKSRWKKKLDSRYHIELRVLQRYEVLFLFRPTAPEVKKKITLLNQNPNNFSKSTLPDLMISALDSSRKNTNCVLKKWVNFKTPRIYSFAKFEFRK